MSTGVAVASVVAGSVVDVDVGAGAVCVAGSTTGTPMSSLTVAAFANGSLGFAWVTGLPVVGAICMCVSLTTGTVR